MIVLFDKKNVSFKLLRNTDGDIPFSFAKGILQTFAHPVKHTYTISSVPSLSIQNV